jgi:hypothetical protein
MAFDNWACKQRRCAGGSSAAAHVWGCHPPNLSRPWEVLLKGHVTWGRQRKRERERERDVTWRGLSALQMRLQAREFHQTLLK